MCILGLFGSGCPLFAVVVGASAVILSLLACVLPLSLRSGDLGDPDAVDSAINISLSS
jgi:hypothetical protein